MTKRYLIWGAPRAVDPAVPVLEAFEQSGRNFGNLLIGNAVHKFLADNELISREELGSPAEADERCDHVVIPAANFLWKDFDFGYMADFLEQTKLPVTIIGVGAQTNDRTMTSTIHPNTLRLMRLISERSALIGVRGYYTAEVLAAYGIHNVSVIGCPSLYTMARPRVSVDASRLRSLESLSVNFSRRVSRHAFNQLRFKALENALLQLAMREDSTFVAQDEIEELLLAADEPVDTGAITSYFETCPKEQVVEFFRTRTRHFRDVDSWSSYIAARSASIGSRFHGNLIALLNGVPAVTIVHDSRTMEMCTLFGSPNIHLNELQAERFTAERLRESLMSASFSLFEHSYRALFVRFVRFLDLNGLEHNLPGSGSKPN